ncbi:MAG: tetratricopeptide repeat protein [Deltaproteobacteria bacterium]|jgi:tetratricopeptide (TPR) repeat protein|nr:tetratricopeptide repeat protein [Deltaproteobacteria bacterium]
MKIWSRLSARDLPRFKEGLASELGELFDALAFEAGPEPAPEAYLSAELSYRGRALGWLNASLKDTDSVPSEEIKPMIPKAAKILLEKAALKKALALDRESGLLNRDSFLAKAAKLMPPLEQVPRSLSLDGEAATGTALALVELQGGWGTEAKSLARRLNSMPGLAALGRISDGTLGLVAHGTPDDIRAQLDATLAALEGAQGAASIASFPDDLGPEDLNPAREPRPSSALLEKARAALAYAKLRGSWPKAAAFRDVLAGMGRITQVLPQGRVITDLGRAAGAAAGQIFTVKDGSGEAKGDIALFETAPGYSLARILPAQGPAAPGAAPARKLAEGDRLEFSGTESPANRASALPAGSAPAPGRDGLLEDLASLASEAKPLLFALARLDDFEKLSAMLGAPEAEGKMDAFASALASVFPSPPDRAAPWEPGCRAFVWSPPPEGAEGLLRDFLKGPSGPGGVSMALVFWPSEVLAPDGIARAGAAALLEGAMTGEAVAVTFGPQTLNILGDRLFDEGDAEGAAREYRRGLQLDPAHLNLLNSLGVCYGRLGDQKAAEAAFDDVLRLDPENLMASFNKGCSQLLSGRPEEAERWLEKAASLDPKNFEVQYQLGKTAIELGHAGKALAALGAAAGLKARRGPVFGLLGKASLLAGDSQGAMAAFKQAVKYYPDDAESLSSLGALYREEARDDKMALSLMRRAVELDPSNPLFRRRLGSLLFDLGRFADAEHHLKSALEYSGRREPGDGGLEVLAAKLKDASSAASGEGGGGGQEGSGGCGAGAEEAAGGEGLA